ncbi:hypothetical protein BG011_009108 [Mortierella polycephala]|uniref:Fe2OG dioxygenase domain-containing protein n=1 Tax=Mortierella polycephala TaxID=41804 RepID=A0A9P6PLT5_9FUNG|nr:hypothetical protein BG011_009108 [Mortierella polycephala]
MSVRTPKTTTTAVLQYPRKTTISKPAIKSIPTLKSTSAPIQIKTLSLQDYLCLQTRPRFLREMRESLIEIGTFYIKDHGVPTELTSGVMKVIQDFFSLPLEEKKKILIGNSRHFRGYKVMGEELTNNEVDHREQLQFGPEQDAINTFVSTVPLEYEGLQGPNQWCTSILAQVPQFKSHILEYMTQLEILSQHLMEAIALSLNLDASYFRDLFGLDPYYRLKCAKYPSVDNAATIGCGAHKDTGFLTVLLQDMVGGLQGQDPTTSEWMDTRPVPETFIVTMGEAVERLTGGLYRATVHRVLNNTSGMDRYSIPFFFDPALDVKVPHQIPVSVSANEPLSPTRSEAMSMSSHCSLSDVEADSDDDDLDNLVAALDIREQEDTSTERSWSNGDHIFETVKRCHPEVYSRWYSNEN